MSSLDAVRARFARNEGLPFADILTEASIREVLNEHGVRYRDRVFSPVTTIWGFLSQVLSQDHSCRDAVSRIIAHRAAMQPTSYEAASQKWLGAPPTLRLAGAEDNDSWLCRRLHRRYSAPCPSVAADRPASPGDQSPSSAKHSRWRAQWARESAFSRDTSAKPPASRPSQPTPEPRFSTHIPAPESKPLGVGNAKWTCRSQSGAPTEGVLDHSHAVLPNARPAVATNSTSHQISAGPGTSQRRDRHNARCVANVTLR
jgi:hypothetical protein